MIAKISTEIARVSTRTRKQEHQWLIPTSISEFSNAVTRANPGIDLKMGPIHFYIDESMRNQAGQIQ